jgi:hypothetical protein
LKNRNKVIVYEGDEKKRFHPFSATSTFLAGATIYISAAFIPKNKN